MRHGRRITARFWWRGCGRRGGRRRLVLGGLALSCLLVTGLAHAQPGAPDGATAGPQLDTCPVPPLQLGAAKFEFNSASRAYRKAKSLLRQGEYDQSMAAIEAGLKIEADDWRLLCLRGDVLLEKNQHAAALEAYEACLPNITRRADKRGTQKVIDQLEVVRTTFVEITVTNGPARVYVQSKRRGLWAVADKSCKKGVLPKTYRIYVERDGFEDTRESVTAKAGETASVEVTLAEDPSPFTVTATPPDAAITLDGERVRAGQERQISAGDHELVVSAPGFAPRRQTVTAREGAPVSIEVALQEVVGVAMPDLPGAAVLLDGEPVELIELIDLGEGARGVVVTAGPHTLTFKATGYVDKDVEIPVDRERGYAIPAPELEPVPEQEPPPPPPPPAAPKEWTVPKVAAVSGAGVVSALALTLSLVDGARASSQWSDAEAVCAAGGGDGIFCAGEGQVLADDARALTRKANTEAAVAVIAGMGALAAWNWRQPAPDEGGMSTRRKVSLGVAAGVAAVGLGIGTVYGLRASSRSGTAGETCDDELVCDADGFVAATQALDDAHVSNLGFLVAATAAGAGAYLWFSAPGAAEREGVRPAAGQSARREGAGQAPRFTIAPTAGAGRFGVTVSGGF